LLFFERTVSLADLTLWLLTTVVEVFVVYLFLVYGLLRKFLFLNLYLLVSPLIGMGRFAILYHSGIMLISITIPMPS
jgi:hypothetical protein